MIILDKITTKQGDKGVTLGPGCKKIKKSSCNTNFTGSLDELNVVIGEVYYYIQNTNEKTILNKIQHDLFEIGGSYFKKEDISDEYIKYLETTIEKLNENLPPLTSFLLPQGSIETIKLHSARTIARRSERVFYAMDEPYIKIYPNIAIYLNRLSDLFFIMLRSYDSKQWKE